MQFRLIIKSNQLIYFRFQLIYAHCLKSWLVNFTFKKLVSTLVCEYRIILVNILNIGWDYYLVVNLLPDN